jgi:hypothetical protein
MLRQLLSMQFSHLGAQLVNQPSTKGEMAFFC